MKNGWNPSSLPSEVINGAILDTCQRIWVTVLLFIACHHYYIGHDPIHIQLSVTLHWSILELLIPSLAYMQPFSSPTFAMWFTPDDRRSSRQYDLISYLWSFSAVSTIFRQSQIRKWMNATIELLVPIAESGVLQLTVRYYRLAAAASNRDHEIRTYIRWSPHITTPWRQPWTALLCDIIIQRRRVVESPSVVCMHDCLTVVHKDRWKNRTLSTQIRL